MKEIASSILNVIIGIINLTITIVFLGFVLYACDMENVKNAMCVFVDKVVDSGQITDYMISDLYNTVSGMTYGVYEIQVNHKIVASSVIPKENENDPTQTYVTEYLGTIDDELNSGDRIEVTASCIRYPLFMQLASPFIGYSSAGKKIFMISNVIR